MISKLKVDLPSIGILQKYLFEVDNDFETPLSSKVDLSKFANKLLDKGVVYVYCSNDDIKGVVGFYCNDNISKVSYLPILSVKQSVRGQGIAKQLVNYAIEHCKQAGMNYLKVDSVNLAAIHVYLLCGFEIESTENIDGHSKYYLSLKL